MTVTDMRAILDRFSGDAEVTIWVRPEVLRCSEEDWRRRGKPSFVGAVCEPVAAVSNGPNVQIEVTW